MMTGFNTGVGFGMPDQGVPNMANHSHKAIMFVFKPHHGQFGKVGMRSFQYHFDENFLGAAAEITDMSQRGTLATNAAMNLFGHKVNPSDYLTASYQPTMMFNGDHLNDKYRFILVLTDNGSSLISNNTVAANLGGMQIRRIYTGFFMDEPYNPATFTETRRTPNPNALMVITHKTVIDLSTSHGMYGSSTRMNTTSSDEIINPELTTGLMSRFNRDNSLHLMTPENSFSSIETTSQGYSMALPGAHSDISRDKGQSLLADSLEQPEHHVTKVIKGLMTHQDEVVTRGRSFNDRADTFFENQVLDHHIDQYSLSRHMQWPQRRMAGLFDLDINTPYSAASIDQMVGGELQMLEIDQPRPQFYDTLDHSTQDVTNQYSYLIAVVIVPMLNAAGLTSMIFNYEIMTRMGDKQEQFQITDAQPQWNVPPHEVIMNAKNVEMELRRGIFATIADAVGGAFKVTVAAYTSGMTRVRLDLIGMGIQSLADFELPSALGGLISPLLGDERANTTNSEQLVGLYGRVSGTSTGQQGFDSDDMDFMRTAETTMYPKALTEAYSDVEEDDSHMY